MPKMKSNRGAAKRFTATSTGKIRHKKASARHILTSKTTKRKRGLRKKAEVSGTDAKKIKRMILHK